MRISLVGPAHPYKGGGARHTTELARELAVRGHTVAIESWRAQYPERLYPGRQTVDAPEGELFGDTRRHLSWNRPLGWWRTGRRAGAEADLVVVTVLIPAQAVPYLGILAGVGARARTLALCHNVLPHERRPGDTALMRMLLRRVDAVLAHSPEQARLVRGLVGDGASARWAPLPPHLPRAQGADAPPAEGGTRRNLLFFGIVRPYKGVDVLLRAFARGAPADVGLTVAGEFWGGSQRLRDLARELGVADRVVFREGYVPAAQLPGLFAGADALVLPYRSATATQNVYLAHEHGLPAIATRAGGLADQVTDGVDGLLCEPGDADDLTCALRRFYTGDTAERLRAAVRPVDPAPHWDAYIEALTG
ncbi:glycosyltransferase family 4 protein [Streptomonospora litoralis]|uniref:GDP-mannose-dependent alpha-(1-6)-phosphatidylinositol monomannoside mannosyltransferase n=1 Tax=Streptomonospora litoralis TaxID=2498135 RepID=A0A4V0ZJ73_9ACTN|nr:glycosyltransferase family 4 protein [Streptomonospora litoralis]QBI52482.1 GDP-mannose-dependent alpha-(1-6)-phosphatidylinositol monomannoside mannosyltransferase [Streptomonospora litoralis]